MFQQSRNVCDDVIIKLLLRYYHLQNVTVQRFPVWTWTYDATEGVDFKSKKGPMRQ